MAKGGAKKQLQDNQARLELLRYLLAATNVIFIFGRLGYYWYSTRWSTFTAAMLMAGLQFFCFRAVTQMAEPLWGPGGELLDGGVDLLHTSLASYYQDLIYLCSFVQVLAVITDKAWWAFWTVPLVAAWLLYTSVLKPFLAQTAARKDIPETDSERKRREKTERKAGRPRFKQAR